MTKFCDSLNHIVCYGDDLWQCSTCKGNFCYAEGNADDELCDLCWNDVEFSKNVIYDKCVGNDLRIYFKDEMFTIDISEFCDLTNDVLYFLLRGCSDEVKRYAINYVIEKNGENNDNNT